MVSGVTPRGLPSTRTRAPVGSDVADSRPTALCATGAGIPGTMCAALGGALTGARVADRVVEPREPSGRSQNAHAVPLSARTAITAPPRGSHRPIVLRTDHLRSVCAASEAASASGAVSLSARSARSGADASDAMRPSVASASVHAARRARAQLAAVLAAARTAAARSCTPAQAANRGPDAPARAANGNGPSRIRPLDRTDISITKPCGDLHRIGARRLPAAWRSDCT